MRTVWKTGRGLWGLERLTWRLLFILCNNRDKNILSHWDKNISSHFFSKCEMKYFYLTFSKVILNLTFSVRWKYSISLFQKLYFISLFSKRDKKDYLALSKLLQWQTNLYRYLLFSFSAALSDSPIAVNVRRGGGVFTQYASIWNTTINVFPNSVFSESIFFQSVLWKVHFSELYFIVVFH